MKVQKLQRTISYLFLFYLLLHGLIYVFQKKIVFQEKRLPQDHIFQFPGEFEELFLNVDNADQINALYFKTPMSRKGVILYLHGNTANLERWGTYAPDFTQRAYDVLMIDYRGYGKSDGKPSEKHLYADAKAAYQWLSARFPPEEIVLHGRSLGTGVATHLATQVPARRLLLETPYNNIRAVVQARAVVFWLAFPFQQAFSSDQRISKITCPIDIIHGTKDKIVPYRCAQKLVPLLHPTKDRFHTIKGAGHKNLDSFPEYFQLLDEILQ